MDESTEVMSLDELMDLAAEPLPAATTQPHVVPPSLLPRPPEPVQPAQPAQPAPLAWPYPASGAHPRPSQPQQGRTDAGLTDSGGAPMQLLLERLRVDGRRMVGEAQRASATGMASAREWLESNDNALIAATVLVTLLLLVVVAAL